MVRRRQGFTQLPALDVSAAAQPSAFFEGLLTDVILLDGMQPRGPEPWCGSSCFLRPQVVKSCAAHPLHKVNACVAADLLRLLHERQPFSETEVAELARRAESREQVDRALQREAAANVVEHNNLPPVSDADDANMLYNTLRARAATSPVDDWYACGTAFLSHAATHADDAFDVLAAARAWEDFVFQLIGHTVFTQPATLAELEFALDATASLVEWLVEQGNASTAVGTSSVTSLTPPRWVRKLRKLCVEVHAPGAVMLYTAFVERAIAAEERLQCGRWTSLTCDVDILQFQVAAPGRRDASFESRDDIAAAALYHFRFSAPRLLGRAGCTLASPAAEFSKSVRTAANNLLFCRNDNKEAERLQDLILAAVDAISTFNGLVGVAEHIPTSVLEPLRSCALAKCRTVNFTNAAAYLAVVLQNLRVGVWLQHHPAVTSSDGLRAALAADTTSLTLESVPSALVTLTDLLQSAPHQIREAPNVLSRLADECISVVDAAFAHCLPRVRFRNMEALVSCMATSSLAVGTGPWTTLSAMPRWTCGCGHVELASSPFCVVCTARHEMGDAGAVTCAACAAVVPSDAAGCANCGADHPRVAAVPDLWFCDACQSSNRCDAPQCDSCGSPNATRRELCATCGTKCGPRASHCRKCGDATAAGRSAAELLSVCPQCSAVGSVSPGAPACHVCHAAGLDAAVTTYFQWTCGCGASNHPSSLQCWRCQPHHLLYTCGVCNVPAAAAPTHTLPFPGSAGGFAAHYCGGCSAMHPRDQRLLLEPRRSTCESCEHPVTTESKGCDSCGAARDAGSDRGAVVDLPWVCHGCGTVCKLTNDADSLTTCKTCKTERPGLQLLHPFRQWTCGSCGMPRCSGYHCSRCRMPHARLPAAEVGMRQCDGCEQLSYAWQAACMHCRRRHPSPLDATKVLVAASGVLRWECRRCRKSNSLINTHCYQCHLPAHDHNVGVVPQSTAEKSDIAKQRLDAAYNLLMQAAVEASDEARVIEMSDNADQLCMPDVLGGTRSVSTIDSVLRHFN